MKAEIPRALKIEHEELHEELTKAAQAGGKTGEAARVVMRVLHPHILLEEEFATPPLGLLPLLAVGKITPDMAAVLSKTEMLKAELPRMLDEHKLILEALKSLTQAATSEEKTRFAQFARRMILHAQTEEQVLYPASILIGEYLKLKLGKS